MNDFKHNNIEKNHTGTDLIPTLIDGAVVISAYMKCSTNYNHCSFCSKTVSCLHNWLCYTGLQYIILDLLDGRTICPTFIHEVIKLRKRINVIMIFVGVSENASNTLSSYNIAPLQYSFIVPEEAVKTLRIVRPEITETSLSYPIYFGASIVQGDTNEYIEYLEQNQHKASLVNANN